MNLSGLGDLVPPAIRPLARRPVVCLRRIGLRPADAIVVSYPKSGSTWLRFLLAHALSGLESDFDSIRDTVAPVGRQRRAPALLPGGGRLLRTHEPLLPRRRVGQRVLYLVRDGRHVALSYLDHERRYGRFAGDVAGFVELFLEGRVDNYGAWHHHVLAALAYGRLPGASLLMLRYEDLRADPVAELARALAFLGMAADEVALGEVVSANTKERMRSKEARSAFLGARRTDGTPFVRPDRRQGWAEVVPAGVRERFQRTAGEALAAAGYPGDDLLPSPRAG